MQLFPKQALGIEFLLAEIRKVSERINYTTPVLDATFLLHMLFTSLGIMNEKVFEKNTIMPHGNFMFASFFLSCTSRAYLPNILHTGHLEKGDFSR